MANDRVHHGLAHSNRWYILPAYDTNLYEEVIPYKFQYRATAQSSLAIHIGYSIVAFLFHMMYSEGVCMTHFF